MAKYLSTRVIATLAGCALLATSAVVNISHMVEGGVPLLSPMPAAIVAIAAGSAVGLIAAVRAWGDGRWALAVLALVAIGCGELFGLVSGAERLLAAREERVRLVAAHNTPRLPPWRGSRPRKQPMRMHR